jgi:formylglycine-generating enzyme required for sulfatase activity
MNNTARPADRKISSSAAQFKKVLQAFANGDLPYSDVQSHLQRLLNSGASHEELREVLTRYESIEPLPAYAHEEILRRLNEAVARAGAPNTAPDSAELAPAPSSAAGSDARPGERSPEPVAVGSDARALPPATLSAVMAVPRPVGARATALSAEVAGSAVENVSSIEDRIARQKADYKALNHAYERVRDAGSAASARTVALAAELAAVRAALESEQSKSQAADKALTDAVTAGEAARARGEESRRELERVRTELRSARDSLAASDATIGQLRLSLGEREDQLAALQADHATRIASLDTRASAVMRLEADLRAERARSTALAAELADKLALAETARKEAEAASEEEALRESKRHQSELGELRSSLATLRARLEADLQTSRAHAAKLATELTSTQTALEMEHSKSRETRRALAERVTAEEAAKSQGEEALGQLEGYRAELSKAREALSAQQQEHTKSIAALQARAKVLEARLQAAETPVAVPKAESKADHEPKFSQEITVALDPPRERATARPAERQAAAPQRGPAPAAATSRIEAREAPMTAREVPTPAPGSARAARFSDVRLFGSRARGPGAKVARFAWAGAALAVIAVVLWLLNHRAPVSEDVPTVVAPADGPKAGSVIRDCPACPALTVVPAGRFKQGSNRTDGNSASFERPPHWVLIGRAFAMSTNPVTVDEFRPFIAATGRDMHGCDTYEDKWRFRPEAGWENPGFVQTGSHPVTCISWDDAKAYAGWLSKMTGHRYRLPSAAEWEYAARAGGEAVRPWNPDGSGACASANVADQRAARRYPGWAVFPCDDGYVYTAPVGSFKANSFGLNDMLGNVFQWTDDCWHSDYTGVPTDGSSRTYGDCSERELRGGSWFTTPEFVRASYRNHFGVNYRASSVGLRLVRDIAS